ncbi:MAG TPA: PA14 domain-containing protein, partial [Verrucomicrobiae bacterium]|nr:PA14 domain-containing protein [Verrucomicrobiae bacterium]
MLQRFARDHFRSTERRLGALLLLALAFALADIRFANGKDAPATGEIDSEPIGRQHYLTNVMQFRALSGKDYLNECAFRLEGVVTFVDTNRNLVVVQDDTGAVALNFNFRGVKFEVGQFAVFEGTNIYPYVVSFPDDPFRPSATDIRTSFEAPTGQGDYYLTRMRGYLRPAVSGEYTFWVASDNSSELWISTSEDP